MPEIPQGAFQTLHRETAAQVGCRIFTILALDPAHTLAWRAYTSHPAEYPVTGTKPVLQDAWHARVIARGESFVANSIAEFSELFDDHDLIRSLGCEAVVNLPVADGKQVIGVVNVLDRAGHFTTARVAALEALVDRHRAALVRAIGARLHEP